MGGSGAGGASAPAAGSSSTHQRTEFVILFIWKEPTPSDGLREIGGTGPTPRPAAPPR